MLWYCLTQAGVSDEWIAQSLHKPVKQFREANDWSDHRLEKWLSEEDLPLQKWVAHRLSPYQWWIAGAITLLEIIRWFN